jgi:hypothetical protein
VPFNESILAESKAEILLPTIAKDNIVRIFSSKDIIAVP